MSIDWPPEFDEPVSDDQVDPMAGLRLATQKAKQVVSICSIGHEVDSVSNPFSK